MFCSGGQKDEAQSMAIACWTARWRVLYANGQSLATTALGEGQWHGGGGGWWVVGEGRSSGGGGGGGVAKVCKMGLGTVASCARNSRKEGSIVTWTKDTCPEKAAS